MIASKETVLPFNGFAAVRFVSCLRMIAGPLA